MLTKITENDLISIRKPWYAGPIFNSVKDLMTNLERALEGLPLDDLICDFIRRSDGSIVQGSSRVPVIVELPQKEKLVVKSYGVYNPTEEKKVLEIVNGRIAPQIAKFDDIGYVEEFVGTNFVSLDDLIFSSLHYSLKTEKKLNNKTYQYENFRTAVEKSAYSFAFLASLGINYNDNHFFDEIRVFKTNLTITDFGNAKLFSYPGFTDSNDWKTFDGQLEKLQKHGANGLFSNYQNPFSLEFNSKIKDYDKILNDLDRLPNDPVLKLNLFNCLGTVAKNIDRYFSQDYIKEISLYYNYTTFSIFGDFVKNFVDFYIKGYFPYSVSHPKNNRIYD